MRKRFFVNGETTAALAQHGQYLIPATQLLEHAKSLNLPIARRVTETGVTLTAKTAGCDEIWIDVPYTPPTPPVKQEKPEEEGYEPYLWVGARIAWERMPELTLPYWPYQAVWAGDYGRSSLQLFVAEPGDRGILSTSPLIDTTDMWYRILGVRNDQAYIDEIAQLNQYGNSTVAVNDTETGLEHPNGLSEPGVNIGRDWVFYTRHGMYMTAWGWSPDWNIDGFVPVFEAHTNADLILDPLASSTAASQRVMDANARAVEGAWPLWDAVVVMDPKPGLQPGDGRNRVRDVDGRPIIGQTINGQYVIKVGLRATACINGPFEIDLEVRVGKAPNMRRRRERLTITRGSNLIQLVKPFGWNFANIDLNPEPEYFRISAENSHQANWWPGAVLADVANGTLSTEPYLLPARGFGGVYAGDIAYPCTEAEPMRFETYIFMVEPWSSGWLREEDGTELWDRAIAWGLGFGTFFLGSGAFDDVMVNQAVLAEVRALATINDVMGKVFHVTWTGTSFAVELVSAPTPLWSGGTYLGDTPWVRAILDAATVRTAVWMLGGGTAFGGPDVIDFQDT